MLERASCQASFEFFFMILNYFSLRWKFVSTGQHFHNILANKPNIWLLHTIKGRLINLSFGWLINIQCLYNRWLLFFQPQLHNKQTKNGDKCFQPVLWTLEGSIYKQKVCDLSNVRFFPTTPASISKFNLSFQTIRLIKAFCSFCNFPHAVDSRRFTTNYYHNLPLKWLLLPVHVWMKLFASKTFPSLETC